MLAPGRDWRKKRPSWLNKERRAKKRRSENHFVSGGMGESILQDHLFSICCVLSGTVYKTHPWLGLEKLWICARIAKLLHGICMWMRPVRRARALRWKKMRSCHRWPADATMPICVAWGFQIPLTCLLANVIKRESYWKSDWPEAWWTCVPSPI